MDEPHGILSSAHVDEDQIIDLVSGLMEPPAVRAAMGHIERCPACESLLKTALQERELLRARGVPPVTAAAPAVRRRRRGLVGSVAVAAMIMLIGVVVWQKFLPRPAGAGYWIPVNTNGMMLRSDGDESFRIFAEKTRPYREHDAEGAIRSLQGDPFAGDETLRSLSRLYLASALVNDYRGGEALPILHQLKIETLPGEWRGPAMWVQYLALRQAGDAAADAVLQAAVAEPGHVGVLAREERDRLSGRRPRG
ncbi:MAG TPA: hypothetical protein VFX92_12885 [Candidatus Krumholzibacteria bacterium]|nr:hypothetical protein [Candidatus Krumholzibacteria bacterium]